MTLLAKYTNPSAWTTALATSTDLDSKATGTAITIGALISNSNNLDLLMDLSLILGSINPSGSPYWEVHLLKLSSDGATFEDRSNSTLVDIIAVTTGASVKNSGSIGIPLPPGDCKLQLVNQTGVTTAASGNSFKYRTYEYNLNA